eukprot:6189924-Pleurochrysis_carterae.AAC.2
MGRGARMLRSPSSTERLARARMDGQEESKMSQPSNPPRVQHRAAGNSYQEAWKNDVPAGLAMKRMHSLIGQSWLTNRFRPSHKPYMRVQSDVRVHVCGWPIAPCMHLWRIRSVDILNRRPAHNFQMHLLGRRSHGTCSAQASAVLSQPPRTSAAYPKGSAQALSSISAFGTLLLYVSYDLSCTQLLIDRREKSVLIPRERARSNHDHLHKHDCHKL